eukprot:2723395-Pyramimonas_sp.AAC.1
MICASSDLAGGFLGTLLYHSCASCTSHRPGVLLGRRPFSASLGPSWVCHGLSRDPLGLS